MPTWKTHIFLNILFFIAWTKIIFSVTSVDIFYPIVVLIFVVIASVFPDIDTTKSKMRDWFSLLLAIAITLFYMFNFESNNWLKIPIYFIGLYLFLRFFPTPHRTITHTFSVCLIFSLAMTLMLWFVFTPSPVLTLLTFLILFISYSSHLILDKF